METLQELEARHEEEKREFVASCPHTEVKVYDVVVGFRHRRIIFICHRCRLNLLGYEIEGGKSYVSYIRDCVKKNKEDC